jgi:WD40 repeat protein
VADLLDDYPARVGKYRILGRLGRGGMGQVFLAESPGGRRVAVKLMLDDYVADQEFRLRFAREIAALRKVGGFYTAYVIEADPNATPPWMVTAYIPGPSLDDVVRKSGPLGIGKLCELGAGLAEALAAVHACGIVHRDLKPSNVIMAADGPRVIDFGIAKADGAETLTPAGVAFGTPSFMSPEQFRHQKVGPASDVFSLGSLLTYAATGHGPFDAPEAPAVMYGVLQGTPDLGLISGRLRQVIHACLAKEPAHRPAPGRLLVAFREIADIAAREPESAPEREASGQPARAWRTRAATRSLDPPTSRVAPPASSLRIPVSAARAVDGLRPQLQVRPASSAWHRVACDPEGRWLATADGDDAIAIWDTSSGLPVRSWSAGARVHAMAAGPGGLLAVGEEGGTVRIWDAGSASDRGSFRVERSRILALAFDRVGTWLASGNQDGVVRLWDVGAGDLFTIGEATYRAVTALAVDWSHGLVAAGDEDGKLRIWDTADPGTPVLLTELSWPMPATALAFGADGEQLAAGGTDGKVLVWGLGQARGSQPEVREVHSAEVLAVAWDPSEHRWVSVAADGSVDAGRPARQRGSADIPLMAAALIAGSGRGVAISENTGRIHVFAVEDPRNTRRLAGTDLALTGACFASAGELIVTCGTDGSLQAWDARAHALKTVHPAGRRATGLCGSPDGTQIATWDDDRCLTLYGVAGRQVTPRWTHRCPDPVTAAAFSPDGSRLVTVGDTVRIWDTGEAAAGEPPPEGARRATAVCFDSAGRRIATGGPHGVVTVWSGDAPPLVLTGHKGPVHAVAFGPGEGQLATAGSAAMIMIWDLSRRAEPRRVALGHHGTVLAVSPADGTLAVGCADGTVRLFSPPDWTSHHVLAGHLHGVTALSFSPDGRRLATASRDGTARQWDLGTRSADLVLVPDGPAWAAASLRPDGTFLRGYGDTADRIWEALGLTRQPLPGLEPGASETARTVTLPTAPGGTDG